MSTEGGSFTSARTIVQLFLDNKDLGQVMVVLVMVLQNRWWRWWWWWWWWWWWSVEPHQQGLWSGDPTVGGSQGWAGREGELLGAGCFLQTCHLGVGLWGVTTMLPFLSHWPCHTTHLRTCIPTSYQVYLSYHGLGPHHFYVSRADQAPALARLMEEVSIGCHWIFRILDDDDEDAVDDYDVYYDPNEQVGARSQGGQLLPLSKPKAGTACLARFHIWKA